MKRVCVSFFATLFILVGLLIITAFIPRSAIRDNVLSSAIKMQEEGGDYYNLIDGKRYTRIHNYADAITLNILYSIGKTDKGVLGDVFLDPHYAKGAVIDYSMTEVLQEAVEQDLAPNYMYDRYWHGMVVYLRPLLVVTDISGVRIISEILLFGLLGFLSVLLWRRKQKLLTISLWIAAAMVALPIAAITMEYYSNWLVMLGISIAVVYWHKDWNQIFALMTISGICCAFFDFLTTETITFVVPMVIALMLRQAEGKTEKFSKELVHVGIAGTVWVVSYLLMYVIKWGISSIITGTNRFAPALEMFWYRQGGAMDVVDIEMFNQADFVWMQDNTMSFKTLAILYNIRNLLGISKECSIATLGLFCLAGLALLAVFYYLYRGKGQEAQSGWLILLLGVVPIVRYIVMYNHSYTHDFFTYRALFGTIVCLILGTWNIVDAKLLAKRFRRRKG